MNSTLKTALPVAVISAALIAVFLFVQSLWLKDRVLAEVRLQQRTEMSNMQVAHQEQMEKLTEKLISRVDQTTRAVDAAIAGSSGDLFVAEGETRMLDTQTMDALADAIIRRLDPMIPTAVDQERGYTTVSERVSTRLNPILTEIARTGNLTRSDMEFYSNQITGMIESALAEDRAEKQQLNTALVTTAAIADDSYRLAQEMSALYLSSLKGEGVLSRILSLPVGLVQDVSTLSIIGSSERKKMEERLFADLGAIETRLDEMRASLPEAAAANAKFEVVEPSSDAASEVPRPTAPASSIRAKPTAPAGS